MKKFILTSSFIVLAFAASAQAADVSSETKIKAENIGAKVEKTIDSTLTKVEKKYNEMKLSVMDGKTNETKFIEQSLNADMTAKKLLGKTIVDGKGEKIGTLEDIIVDAEGNANWAVVADGDFVGVGKKAVFKYSSVVNQNSEGDIVTTISENNIKTAKEFSYDAKEASQGKVIIPPQSYSVKGLLDADVETAAKNMDLDLENIAFKGDKAAYFVFEADDDRTDKDGFAAVAFTDVKLTPKKDNEVDLSLTASQEQSLISHISTAAE